MTAGKIALAQTRVQQRHRPWVLLALMLTIMMAAMDTTIVATAVPQVVADLGGFALFGWVFAIYLLVQTVTIPIYGKLADMRGRKPVLLIGGGVFLLGSAASALAWNMSALIVFRSLQGLGAGAIMATVNTLAGDLYTLQERARIQGVLASAWGIAAVAGPSLGGALAQYATWRWIFLINLPIGGLALALLALCLHEQVKPVRRPVDYLGAATILLTVGLAILALLQGGVAWPWLSWPSLALLFALVILAPVAVWTQYRAAEPIMPGWLLKRRGLASCNIAMVGLGLAVIGPGIYLPLYAQSVLGLNAIAAGLVLASMSLGWPTASALAGYLYLRIGFRDTALLGTLLMGLAVATFLLLGVRVSVGALVAIQITLGAGFGLLSTAALVGAQNSVDWYGRGVVTGANMFTRLLGESLGAAIFGAVFNTRLSAYLHQAPAHLAAQLPDHVDQVLSSGRQGELARQAADYLQQAIHMAMHSLYISLAIVVVLTCLAVVIMPRRFGWQTENPS